MTYIVRYNHTAIIDISVDIETIDVEGATREVQQEFSAKFVADGMVARSRSGNPGYIAGKLILGGMSPNVNHTASYVIAQKAGFTVMDTGKRGQCSSSSPNGSVRWIELCHNIETRVS